MLRRRVFWERGGEEDTLQPGQSLDEGTKTRRLGFVSNFGFGFLGYTHQETRKAENVRNKQLVADSYFSGNVRD